MKNLYSFLPCYNEELNIGDLINEWISHKDELLDLGYNLVVYAIDDCSKDSTKEVIKSKVSEYPENVVLIEHVQNKGLCGGLNTSISHFIENAQDGDLMSLMDGDNTHNPVYILDMIKKLNSENCSCVIASRYCEDSSIVGVASHREFMSDMAKIYYSLTLSVPNVKDYTCGYRVYTYDIIKNLVDKYGKDPIKEKSFACMMELLYKLYLSGATFDEVGFRLRYDNKQGESKMKVFTTMKKSLTTALKLRIKKDI